MMYIGDQKLVESSVNDGKTDNSTRILPVQKSFGLELKVLQKYLRCMARAHPQNDLNVVLINTSISCFHNTAQDLTWGGVVKGGSLLYWGRHIPDADKENEDEMGGGHVLIT